MLLWFVVSLLLTAFNLENKAFYNVVAAFWRLKYEDTYENQVLIAQIVCKKECHWHFKYFMAPIFHYGEGIVMIKRVSLWLFLNLTFILLGYSANVILHGCTLFLNMAREWWCSGCVSLRWLFKIFWELWRRITLSLLISRPKFLYIWFLISMKFCIRIISKKTEVRKCNSAKIIKTLQLHISYWCVNHPRVKLHLFERVLGPLGAVGSGETRSKTITHRQGISGETWEKWFTNSSINPTVHTKGSLGH